MRRGTPCGPGMTSERCGGAAARRAVLALAVLGQLLRCTGQGLPPSQQRFPGPKAYDKLRGWTAEGEGWRSAFASSPESTCRNASSWCAAPPGSDEYVKLVLAGTPSAYDARKDASSSFNPIGPVGDQRPCQTSVAFAVAAAAEAAVASALQINGSSVSLSQQDLQFCPNVERGCYDNGDLKTALNRLVKGGVVAYDCLPYTAAQSDDPAKLCNYRCNSPPKPVGQGRFGFSPVRDPIAAQKQIRRYGSFVTRFNLHADFAEWLRKSGGDAGAVYGCPDSDKPAEEAQAVAVVGYDNKAGYWLVKNSWGTSNGAGGYFKVKFGMCGMLAPSDSFGVFFIPKRQRQLPVTALSSQDGSRGRSCYIYKARSDDFLGRIADSAVVNLGTLLQDNLQTVRNLDKPLTGLRLRLCNPDPASVSVAPAPGAKGQDSKAGGEAAAPGAGGSGAAKEAREGGEPAAADAKAGSSGSGSDDSKAAGKAAKAAAGAGTSAASLPTAPLSAPSNVSGSTNSSAAIAAKAAESAALLALKASLGATQLKWENGTDPCAGWPGIYCSEYGGQQRVYMVDLSSQGLSGALSNDVDLSVLEYLQALWLYGNQLTGKLPASWAKLKAIQEVNLYGNALTGSLPPEWSGMPATLKRLYLNGNRLSGELPGSWSALEGVESLSLASNGFSGSVPASWGSMAALKSISLYDNPSLRGCLPEEWQTRTPKVELLAGPLSADGIPTLSLSSTAICGSCGSLECENATAASGGSASNGTNSTSGGGDAPEAGSDTAKAGSDAPKPGGSSDAPKPAGGSGSDSSDATDQLPADYEEPDTAGGDAAGGGEDGGDGAEASPPPGASKNATAPGGAGSSAANATSAGGAGAANNTSAGGASGSSSNTPGSIVAIGSGSNTTAGSGGNSSGAAAAAGNAAKGVGPPAGATAKLGSSPTVSSTRDTADVAPAGPTSLPLPLPSDSKPVDASLTVTEDRSNRKPNLQSVELSGAPGGSSEAQTLAR